MTEKPIVTIEEVEQFFNDASQDYEGQAIGLYEAFQDYLKKNNEAEISAYLAKFQDKLGASLSDDLMKPSFVIGRVEHQKYAGIKYSNPMLGYMLRRLNDIDPDEAYRKMKQSIKLAHSAEEIKEKIANNPDDNGEDCLYPPQDLIEKIAHKYVAKLHTFQFGLGTKTIENDGSTDIYKYDDQIVNE